MKQEILDQLSHGRQSIELRGQISKRLRAVRNAAGYSTAAKFARAAGVSEVTYRAQERGARSVKLEDLRLYSDALGIRWEWVVTGEGEPAREDSAGDDKGFLGNLEAFSDEMPRPNVGTLFITTIELKQHPKPPGVAKNFMGVCFVSPFFRYIQTPIDSRFYQTFGTPPPFLVFSSIKGVWANIPPLTGTSDEPQTRIFLANYPSIDAQDEFRSGENVLLLRDAEDDRVTESIHIPRSPIPMSDPSRTGLTKLGAPRTRGFISSWSPCYIGRYAELKNGAQFIVSGFWGAERLETILLFKDENELFEYLDQCKGVFLESLHFQGDQERDYYSELVHKRSGPDLAALVGLFPLNDQDFDPPRNSQGGIRRLVEMTQLLPSNFLYR